MTQHILTLSNYLTSPIDSLKGFFKAIEKTQMARAIVHVRKEMMKHKAYRETYNELSKLSNKELADIGIARGEIHSIAMEAYFDNRIG